MLWWPPQSHPPAAESRHRFAANSRIGVSQVSFFQYSSGALSHVLDLSLCFRHGVVYLENRFLGASYLLVHLVRLIWGPFITQCCTPFRNLGLQAVNYPFHNPRNVPTHILALLSSLPACNAIFAGRTGNMCCWVSLPSLRWSEYVVINMNNIRCAAQSCPALALLTSSCPGHHTHFEDTMHGFQV